MKAAVRQFIRTGFEVAHLVGRPGLLQQRKGVDQKSSAFGPTSPVGAVQNRCSNHISRFVSFFPSEAAICIRTAVKAASC